MYIAGGFSINRNTHKPYIVPDLQLFNQTTQRWQHLTTIPNLDLSHALLLNENKLHVSETIELPDQLPETKVLRSFDLRKLIWIESKNDTDNRKMNEKNSTLITPSSSPYNLSPDTKKTTDVKTNQNIQVIYFIKNIFD